MAAADEHLRTARLILVLQLDGEGWTKWHQRIAEIYGKPWLNAS